MTVVNTIWYPSILNFNDADVSRMYHPFGTQHTAGTYLTRDSSASGAFGIRSSTTMRTPPHLVLGFAPHDGAAGVTNVPTRSSIHAGTHFVTMQVYVSVDIEASADPAATWEAMVAGSGAGLATIGEHDSVAGSWYASPVLDISTFDDSVMDDVHIIIGATGRGVVFHEVYVVVGTDTTFAGSNAGPGIHVEIDRKSASAQIELTNVVSDRITLYRHDEVYGSMIVRGADNVKVLNHRFIRFEDGEVPLDTPLSYCVVMHLDPDPLKRPVIQHNLIRNPSFEHNTAGWTELSGRSMSVHHDDSASGSVPLSQSWLPLTHTTNAVVTPTAYSDVIVEVTDAGSASVTSELFPVSPGQTYQISAGVRAVQGARDVTLTLKYYNSAGTVIQTSTSDVKFFIHGRELFVAEEELSPALSTHASATLTMLSASRRSPSLPGDSVELNGQFTVEHVILSGSVSGTSALALGGVTASQTVLVPTPYGTTVNTYGVVMLPMPAAHLLSGGYVPGDTYRVSGNMLISSTADTIPATWKLVPKRYKNWADLKRHKSTWRSVQDMRFQSYKEVKTYLMVMGGSGPIMSYDLGVTGPYEWNHFSVTFVMPAGGKILAICQDTDTIDSNGVRHSFSHLEWLLDAFQIEHTLIPDHALEYLDGDTNVSTLDNSQMQQQDTSGWKAYWKGNPHESMSILVPPEHYEICARSVTIQSNIAIAEVGLNCVSVHLNDPLLPSLGTWAVFQSLDSWKHPARVKRHAVVSRPTPVPVNDIRMSMTNTIRLLTKTTTERLRMRRLQQSGRVLILQFPMIKNWGESVLYISVGDVTENFISDDYSREERVWDLPFQVVSRPFGWISLAITSTWLGVEKSKEWDDWTGLEQERTTWQDVMRDDGHEPNYYAPMSHKEPIKFNINHSGVIIPRLGITSGGGPSSGASPKGGTP